MNNDQSIFDLIEQYHQGFLSENERNLVELRMQTDAAFAEYVKLNDLANELVHSTGLDLLREKMNADLTRIERKRIQRHWRIGIGIVAALLAISFLLYFIKPSNNSLLPTRDLPSKENHSDPAENKSEYKTERNNRIQVKPELNMKVDIPDEEIKNHTVISSTLETSDSSYNTTIKEENKTIDRKQIQEVNKNECNLSFEAIAQMACRGEKNGSIVINQKEIAGGTAPYYFHLSNSDETSSSGIFPDLTKGSYTITITDSKACSYSREIIVHEKNCSPKKSFSFNPDYGEKWTGSAAEGKSGSFTIYNRAGIIIFTGSFNEYAPAEWQGINASGISVEMGLYICSINYLDGTNEIIEISIIR